ncbi:hypothetical protein MMC25_000210, partial [Agyrium rufum]|nr:hypothetical protein [Agyrium rufum]
MAEPTQAPSAPTSEEAVKINWEEASSKDGTKYEVGRPDVPKPPTDENLVGSKADFQISVKWTVGGDSWIDTPLEVRNTTAIWRYKLHLSSHPFHKYVLEISITDDHYDYYFGDEE